MILQIIINRFCLLLVNFLSTSYVTNSQDMIHNITCELKSSLSCCRLFFVLATDKEERERTRRNNKADSHFVHYVKGFRRGAAFLHPFWSGAAFLPFPLWVGLLSLSAGPTSPLLLLGGGAFSPHGWWCLSPLSVEGLFSSASLLGGAAAPPPILGAFPSSFGWCCLPILSLECCSFPTSSLGWWTLSAVIFNLLGLGHGPVGCQFAPFRALLGFGPVRAFFWPLPFWAVPLILLLCCGLFCDEAFSPFLRR